ncbi:type I secretion system permease/ATPase [Aliiroseovarius marinus]|uniref:type I secretion system permease/ATPase n=1 Tax=Aliiroseovarius marinus TaxID=2500159 RepID=UPI003D7E841F
MQQDTVEYGLEELRAARRKTRALFIGVAVFSVFTNLLMLTAPLYMLQLYDRVLGSRSEATLVALTLLMAFLFIMMGVLDYARGRVLARIGAQFQEALDHRVFSAMLRQPANTGPNKSASAGLQDLEAIQRYYSSPVSTAIFDVPWTPLFLFAIVIFHPWLGALALVGGAVLVAITVLNQIFTRVAAQRSVEATLHADHLAEQMRLESEMVRALGMSGAAYDRWHLARREALAQTIRAADSQGHFSNLSKTFRQFLQSAMLGLGAYLALLGEISPGAMIAGSILLGRALAPVDMLIGQWQTVQRARVGWRNLGALLGKVPKEEHKTQLPRPKAHLRAENVTVIPPGSSHAVLRTVSFEVKPGIALGVIGPSGSGKTTLAKVLTGVQDPAGGVVRLDNASLDQYTPEALGQYIGYLPQRVQLFDGTIAENIAGLDLEPDSAQVVAAAKSAAAHEMILALPDGYDTKITPGSSVLSGGQMQRIGLARALYGDPEILVLDEPNSNLDNTGSIALNTAIRNLKSRGGAVLIMAHRPAAIQECELLLVLDGGHAVGFGPRDQVLAEHVKNARKIRETQGMGGVS